MNFKKNLHESWFSRLKNEFKEDYFIALIDFLELEKAEHEIFPPEKQIFTAFNLTSFEKTNVIILGQDPYHGKGQAHGLAFSVSTGVTVPPSLKNIFKELHSDLGFPIPDHGNLTKWAKEGVLLLNTILTVRANKPGSHQNKGWETFNQHVISTLCDQKNGLVFLLWGAFAQKMEKLIDPEKHYILKAAHPSPFSAHTGFFGCRHFSKTNEILKNQGKQLIDWEIKPQDKQQLSLF